MHGLTRIMKSLQAPGHDKHVIRPKSKNTSYRDRCFWRTGVWCFYCIHSPFYLSWSGGCIPTATGYYSWVPGRSDVLTVQWKAHGPGVSRCCSCCFPILKGSKKPYLLEPSKISTRGLFGPWMDYIQISMVIVLTHLWSGILMYPLYPASHKI